MANYDSDAWPSSLPAVAQLLRDGLDLAAGVTFLVGENGTGKSTLIEVLCASHSPLLTAMPDATILELGGYGYRKRSWADLELVDHWKRYLADPQAYLHHVLD